MKNIVRIALAAISLGAIVYLTWWAAGTSAPSVKPLTNESSGSERPNSFRPNPLSPALPPSMTAGSTDPDALKPSGNGLDGDVFEEKLHEILVNENISHDQAAIMLLDLLPAASVEQQIELSQHASNLLSDEQYSRIRGLLLDPKVDQEVKEVWYSDLLNREHTVTMPVLADIAKQPSNPFSEEAIDTLSIILDAEIATNPLLIDAAVKKYLDEQRAEEADTLSSDPLSPSGQ